MAAARKGGAFPRNRRDEGEDETVVDGDQVRRGLVLGGGGVLGYAWMVGALAALEKSTGLDCRQVDIIVGTSAGALVGSVLGCGISVPMMLRQQMGAPAPGDFLIDYNDELNGGRPRPSRPHLRPGSMRLLLTALRNPRSITPRAALSALLPLGRGSLAPIEDIVELALGPQRTWAPHPALWIVAMNYDSGERVAFGRAGSPFPSLPAAVGASCAIPGWFTPVDIDGRRYVDGGMYSSTSADLLAQENLDEIYVVAPLAAFALDSPTGMLARLERRWRRSVTRRLRREMEHIIRSGAKVYVLCPGLDDLTAMGANLMDVSRRSLVIEVAQETSLRLLRQQLASVRV